MFLELLVIMAFAQCNIQLTIQQVLVSCVVNIYDYGEHIRKEKS